MENFLLISISLIVCAIAAASFAADRSRHQLGWFVAGLIFGPIALAFLLSRPALSEEQIPTPLPQKKKTRSYAPVVRNILSFFAIMTVILMVIGLGLLELWGHSQRQAQTRHLERWEQLGDGLLEVSRQSAGTPPVSVRSARSQVRMYADSLHFELGNTERDLALAVAGQSEVFGLEAVWTNITNLFSLQPVGYPATADLTNRNRDAKVGELTERLSRYANHIGAISQTIKNWKHTG